MKSTPLAFFGTADFSATILKSLLANEWNVTLVITRPDAPVGRRRRLQPPTVKTLAQQHDIAVLQPTSAAELNAQAPTLKPYQWGVVASYGLIIPAEILAIFEGGLINVHPSLLPRWRGPSPIEATLLHGDNKTGNSLMKLTAFMDAGPVYTASELAIDEKTDRVQLQERLAADGAQLLVDNLDTIVDGSLTPEPQDESQATYSRLLTKADAWIDWEQSAQFIDRRVRAYREWPGNKSYVYGTLVDVEEVHVVDACGEPGTVDVINDQPVVYASDTGVALTRLKPSGRRSMSGPDFVRGYM